MGTPSPLGFLGGELVGDGLVLEVAAMGAVAEGLGLRHAAAAERYGVAAVEVVGVAGGVDDGEIALYFDGAVVVNGEFGCHDGRSKIWCEGRPCGVTERTRREES